MKFMFFYGWSPLANCDIFALQLQFFFLLGSFRPGLIFSDRTPASVDSKNYVQLRAKMSSWTSLKEWYPLRNHSIYDPTAHQSANLRKQRQSQSPKIIPNLFDILVPNNV